MNQDQGASAKADRAATPSEPSPAVSGKAGIPCAAFTPGPWQRMNDYDGALTIIGNVDGESFSDGTTSYTYDFIANCEDEYGEPASNANVRLILAAPELYGQLERAVDLLDSISGQEFSSAVRVSRETLAKARGEQVAA